MLSKLTVIFYIILCLQVGIVLTVLPWLHPLGLGEWAFGLSDWGDNFFLLYASQKIGLEGLPRAVSSGWVRGAVTGLGLLNFAMAFWEITHFRQTVRALEGERAPVLTPKDAPINGSKAPSADDNHVSHHERRDDPRDPRGH